MYNTCAETHLGGGVMRPFVSPLSTIARAHDPTVIGNVAFKKGKRRFCLHRSNHCHALMLTCWNSLLWQHCEHFNNVFFVLATIAWSIESVVITWHVVIGMSRKLAAYNYTSSLLLWTVQAGGCKWRYPKGQSRTWGGNGLCVAVHPLGGSGGMPPPRKIFEF